MGSSGRQCPHATRRAQQDLSFTVGSTALTMAWKCFFSGGGGGMRRGGGMRWLCYYFLDALVNIDLHPFNFAALLYSYLN